MEHEVDDTIRMDRLEKLLAHPETVAPEDLEAWLADKEFLALYATAMDARRVLLERQPLPDAKSEFRSFRRWRMEQSEPAPLPQQSAVHRRMGWWIGGVVAACLLVLVAFHLGTQWNHDSDSIQVYYAQAETGKVILTMGQDTVSLAEQMKDSLTLLPGMNMNQENGLQYNAVAKAVPQKAMQHSLSTSIGKTFQLTLPDGTRVWLNAESRLNYPRSFTGNTRTVRLTGEAYFEVAKDAAHPFIVQSGAVKTTVLGTSFNVRNYAGEAPHVTLVEGSVNVTHQGQHLTLMPGQDATLDADNRLVSENVDIKYFICWKDGYFYFDNMSLREIMVQVGKWYNVDVIFAHPRHLNDLLHFHAEKEWSIDELIQQINLICETKVYLKDNVLIVE